MFATIAALGIVSLLAPGAYAQATNSTNERYVVWSSVVFTRTGERTPEVLGKIPPQLTSLGAQQAYAAGQFFRHRYTLLRNGTNGAENAGAELIGLNANLYDQDQVISMALEQQYNMATQQAFMQGLYPPTNLGNSSTTGGLLSPINILANGTYVSAPLGGYQYPQLRSAGPLDADFVSLSGHLNCPAWEESIKLARATPSYDGTQEEFDGLYDVAGSAALIGVLPNNYWDYNNAYAIYDYLAYQNAHNSTVRNALAGLRWTSSNVSFLDTLRYLSDQQQFAMLGNLSALNVFQNKHTLTGASGSISTIAGNTFAARVLDSLNSAVMDAAFGRYKLNLFFADYHPLTSFFSLMGLPNLNQDFYGAPNFASSAAFELFSYTNETDPQFPSTDDLWVRFYFRNGTEGSESTYRAYSLFNRGPDQLDMRWTDFSYSMQNNMMAGIGNWCNECHSTSFFCAAFDQNGNEVSADSRTSSSSSGSGSGSGGLSPAVAGVIGAIIALVVAALIFALTMLFGGIRLYRNPSTTMATMNAHKSPWGGFKGGQKMQSDQDLAIPKGGAVVVGASAVNHDDEHDSRRVPGGGGGHERVGSWELKHAEAGSRNLHFPEQQQQQQQQKQQQQKSPRPSQEEIRHDADNHDDPFADPSGLKPTQTREHV